MSLEQLMSYLKDSWISTTTVSHVDQRVDFHIHATEIIGYFHDAREDVLTALSVSCMCNYSFCLYLYTCEEASVEDTSVQIFLRDIPEESIVVNPKPSKKRSFNESSERRCRYKGDVDHRPVRARLMAF